MSNIPESEGAGFRFEQLDERCDAVIIDTSVFIAEHYRWKNERLGHLSQLPRHGLQGVVTDIVVEETKLHIARDIETKLRALEKAVQATDFLSPELRERFAAESAAADQIAAAHARFQDFLEENKIQVLKVGDLADVKEVFERYFAARPPFSATSSKKHEFPDAFSLGAAESWCKKNKIRAWIVSGDGDHERFCQQSSDLVHVPSLKQLFGILNLRSEVGRRACQFVVAALDNPKSEVYRSVARAVEKALWEYSVDAEADAAVYYRDIESGLSFEDIMLNEGDEASPTVLAEDVGNGWAVVEADLEVEATAHATFQLYVIDGIDKDEVPMGTASRETNVTLEMSVILRLEGEFQKDPLALELTDVEVPKHGRGHVSVHFGQIPIFGDSEEAEG